jgi:Mitochondrial pyruvate carriers
MLTKTSNVDFWGPASNFGIPIAAVMDTQKDPEMCVPLQLSSSFPRPQTKSSANNTRTVYPAA